MVRSAPLFAEARSSSSEGGHPGPSLFDEDPRPHDAYTFARPEVSHVVGHEERRAGADRRGQDRNILRISQGTSPLLLLRRWPIDSDWHRAKELLEEGQGLRELVGQVPPDLVDDGLREDQCEEADFT
jgi:hypothetical protein